MTSNSTQQLTHLKRWSFRLFALSLGVLPFVILEASLVALGVGESDPKVDPFIGFANVIPLFELDDSQKNYVISPARRKFFAHDEFPAVKRKNTFRIFCLGGSTVQGRPYSIETSFTSWLRIALETASPTTNWEVVNCGGISYASYRLSPILDECLNYEPDLFIICTGHNEFLEDRSYEGLKNLSQWRAASTFSLTRSRTVSTVSRLLNSQEPHKSILTVDADAMLDYRNGIAAFHRDETWNAGVAKHFESNLKLMVRKARSANIPTLFLHPPSNLSGIAPFKSESALTGEKERKQVQDFKERARSLYRNQLTEATELWEEICNLDSLSARNWYELGQCLEIQGRSIEARRAYINSRDLDICPLRMTSPLEQALHRIVARENVDFIDCHNLLESRTRNGILGNQWLVDHVHPSFEGHQQIGIGIAEWMASKQMITLPSSWKESSQRAFNSHFESLESRYFHKGQRALQALRKWTQSDTDGAPAEARFPHRFEGIPK